MTLWLIFIIAGVGTLLIRMSGILVFHDPERISPTMRRALRMIAPAAMGAIVANTLILDQGEWRAFGPWHVAALVAVGVGAWRRSMGWAMAAGVATFALARLLV